MKDTELLEQKICPDCGLSLYFYFETKEQPWCKTCDVYFTRMGEWVVRNENALQQYNDNYAEKQKQAEEELKGKTQ
jgi:hypothetical protein